jgi:hypothetical protein
MIQYEARMVQAGGPNDRVSDLNAFWMATDSRSAGDLFAAERPGKFSDYNQLRTYYVGQGGNSNTTTRFRRYIGDAVDRPLLPEHDLRTADMLLQANAWQTVQLVALGNRIQYYRDRRLIFDFTDAAPYTHGHFGLRTAFSHVELRHFEVYRIAPKPIAPNHGAPGAGLPSSVRRRILPSGCSGSWGEKAIWLSLKATDHQGEGPMKRVTSILRVSTKGGMAPTSGCDAQHKGREARSHYTAIYLFYSVL